jgi:ribosomal protein L37AE/L43A
MNRNTEEITCPNCKEAKRAVVEHTQPFWTYIHHCNCGYTITESEWETTERYKDALAETVHNLATNN